MRLEVKPRFAEMINRQIRMLNTTDLGTPVTRKLRSL